MVNPKLIIESAVRTQAMSVRSAAIPVRLIAKRSTDRTSTGLIPHPPPLAPEINRSLRRRVPDRRRVGPLLESHRRARQRRVAEALDVVGGPARRRDLEHAQVVERALRGVELGVLPHAVELRRAD